MKRKTYIVITITIVFIVTVLSYKYDNTRYENIFSAVVFSTLSIWFLYTAYLLMVKKSYNLLAGMTEKEAAKIKNNPEEEKKVIKTAKIVGYIFIITALVFLLEAWLSSR